MFYNNAYTSNKNNKSNDNNMKKTAIQAGLSGLLTPTPAPKVTPVEAPQPAPAREKAKADYKTVCYSISPDLAEKIKDIAYWDRKKINAVVAEAFTEYINRWDKANK